MDRLFTLMTLLALAGTAFAADGGKPQAPGGQFLMLMMLMFFGIWFLMIAPQRKR